VHHLDHLGNGDILVGERGTLEGFLDDGIDSKPVHLESQLLQLDLAVKRKQNSKNPAYNDN